jgi:hypothetical protein
VDIDGVHSDKFRPGPGYFNARANRRIGRQQQPEDQESQNSADVGTDDEHPEPVVASETSNEINLN